MFINFNEEARKILKEAKKESKELGHPYIGSEHLLLAILKNKNELTNILNKYNLTYDIFYKEIVKTLGKGETSNDLFIYTPLLKKIITEAIIESKEKNEEITVKDLFIQLLEESEGVAIRIIMNLDISIENIYDEIEKNKKNKQKRSKKLLIEDYGYNMNEKAIKGELDPIVGRDEELETIIEILCRRTKNNPLLIGEAGVGKTALVEGLSTKIAQNNIPDLLKNKKIYNVSMSSLVSGTKYRGEFEERINKLLKEVEENKDIILFIDEIHTLVGAGGAEGAIDASNILKPVLARAKIKVIGATTKEEYKKYIEKDKALARRFQTIFIEEPSKEKTKEILLKLKPIYEQFHKVIIKEEIIDKIIDYSDRYIYNRFFPDKAIDIMDEASVKAANIKNDKILKKENLTEKYNQINANIKKLIQDNEYSKALELSKKEKEIESKINHLELISTKSKLNEVTVDMVNEVVAKKTKIPIYEFSNDNNKQIIKAKKKLKDEVYGQDEAIEKLCNAFKRISLGYKIDSKPTSFLFVGPTGVGKTYLAKEFTKKFYGAKSLITLDMSEYKEEHTISKIIGSPPGYVGYDSQNTVLDEIKDNPYSVLLLDEFDKAHPSVINLFLQVLENGTIKTSTHEKIYLGNITIIMTANINIDNNKIGFNKDENNIINKLKEHFGIEIINRIDYIVPLNKLTKEDIKKIIDNKIKKKKEYFSKNNCIFSLKEKCIEEIIEESNYNLFGARRIDKVMHDKIDNYIIDKIIEGKNNLKIETIKN